MTRFEPGMRWTSDNSTPEERMAFLGFDPFEDGAPKHQGTLTVTGIDDEGRTITVSSGWAEQRARIIADFPRLGWLTPESGTAWILLRRARTAVGTCVVWVRYT